MGLWIQSLEEIPADAKRNYYIYLLDYGWSEPLGDVLKANFEKMAESASKNNAVVVKGTDRIHFENEVLSYHRINGEDAEDILPAILITNRNPHQFKEMNTLNLNLKSYDFKMILIPIRKFCKSSTDVIELIDKIFKDIKGKKVLNDFVVSKVIKKDKGRNIVDSLILEPNISGVGIDLKKLIKSFSK